MKSLIKIILSLLVPVVIGNSQKLYFGESIINDIININPKQVDIYYAEPHFDLRDKKVKLVEPHDYIGYVSMIDPEAEEVQAIASNINNKGNLNFAKEIYYFLKNRKIRYSYDPGDSKETFLERLYLEAELSLLGRSPIEASLKDYVKHPEQTLKDKGGDCEDISILYTSLLLAKGIWAGLITFQNHAMSLFKVTEKEIKENNLEHYLKDAEGNFWLPIEMASIEKDNFNEALKQGYENFLQGYPCYRIVFNANGCPIIFEKQIVKQFDNNRKK
ncbi:MAG: hypothetical protein ACPLXC_01630 [Candidatus Pacearchaeota archaeon]